MIESIVEELLDYIDEAIEVAINAHVNELSWPRDERKQRVRKTVLKLAREYDNDIADSR